jgi:hypothetical protein
MRIGAYAFVMMASGRLRRMPKISPYAQPGRGSRDAPMTKPMAKRFRNAPARAADLSSKLSGSIEAADREP